jgi:hypothetical protein
MTALDELWVGVRSSLGLCCAGSIGRAPGELYHVAERTMTLERLLLPRIQFGFKVSFHIIFPAFTVELGGWLATLEGLHLVTGNAGSRRLFDFWLKILRGVLRLVPGGCHISFRCVAQPEALLHLVDKI